MPSFGFVLGYLVFANILHVQNCLLRIPTSISLPPRPIPYYIHTRRTARQIKPPITLGIIRREQSRRLDSCSLTREPDSAEPMSRPQLIDLPSYFCLMTRTTV